MVDIGGFLSWLRRRGRSGDAAFLRAGAADATARDNGLILIEIDDYAVYERLFGESVARSLLHAIEQRIAPALPGASEAWSPGRGRLAVTLTGTNLEQIRACAQDLQRRVARDGLATSQGRIFVTVSAGCAVAEPAAMPQLGPTAQRSLDQALREGRGHCRAAAAAIEAEDAALAEAAIRHVDAARVIFAYQPVRRFGGSGRPAFIEMLARLPNEGATPVAAGRFLPAITDAGRGPMLDRLALNRALDLLTANPMARISVNVGRATMEDPVWLATLTERCAVDLTLGDRLIVELGEADVAAAPALAGGFLAGVRNCGAAIALDRFGAEALAEQDLRALRFDFIKLAPQLCHGIADATGQQAQLRLCIDRALAHDMTIVATGIERQVDADWLAEQGATHGQGMFLAAPECQPDLAEPHAGHRPNVVPFSLSRASTSRAAPASP